MAAQNYPMIGATGLGIVAAAVRDGEFRCKKSNEIIAAGKAMAHRYLTRDPKDGSIFRPGDNALGLLDRARTEGKLPEAGAPNLPERKVAVARRIDSIRVFDRLRFLNEAKVLSLMDSISKGGLKTPITVYGKETDVAADLSAGEHRLEACTRLGHEAILCFHEDGDELDRQLWEIDENLIRSDLSVSERALFMARRKEIYLVKYPETAHGGDRASRKVCDLKADNAKRFTVATAEATGRKERSVQLDVERGQKISKNALQLLTRTRHDKGETLDHLKRLETAEAQEGFVRDLLASDKAVKAESKIIRSAEQAKNRESRLRMVNLIAEHGRKEGVDFPRAAYPIIYADPPWEQEAWSDETGQDKGLKYPSMTLEEIKELCKGDKSPATASAELWLWATANRSKHALEVMEAWGFEFVTEIIWDKIDIGMGRHVRDRHEKVLIGKRGPISIAPLLGMQPPSLYSEKKSEHSRKPVWFAEQIERQWPELRKLELFQRKESLADGDIRLNGMWDFWGNQAGSSEGGAA